MSQIQFIQITPEQLKKEIVEGVKSHIDDLKKSFNTKSNEEYLTRNDVATMFQVDISTVHNWAKAGKLNKKAIGNRVYFLRSEVEKSLIDL